MNTKHKEKLKEIHQKSLITKLNLSSEVKKELDEIDKIIEKGKSTPIALITLGIHKILNPKQDIRKHQKKMDNGFSARFFDTKYINPTLCELGLTYCSESAWVTRSLEVSHPYDENYPGAIRFGKKSFLKLVNLIETEHEQHAENIVLSILQFFNKIKEETPEIIKPLTSSEKLSLNKVFVGLDDLVNKKYSSPHGAKFPVLIINSLLKVLCKEVKRYENCNVKKIGSHLSSDSRSKASGDIEIFKDDILFESYEIKKDVEINNHIVNRAKKKIYLHNPKRYFLLSSKVSKKEKNLINEKLALIKKEHGCEVIIDNPLYIIKNYICLISKLDYFIQDLGEMIIKDPDLKIEHKKEWEYFYKSINQT